jgi:hypothetical protein
METTFSTGAVTSQSQRYTVGRVGRRSIGRPHCALCGCARELVPGSGLCQHQCFWFLIGWIGYNATNGEVVFKDIRALKLAKMHGWDPATRTKSAKSWPRVVAAARELGWSGNTDASSQPTFVDMEAL